MAGQSGKMFKLNSGKKAGALVQKPTINNGKEIFETESNYPVNDRLREYLDELELVWDQAYSFEEVEKTFISILSKEKRFWFGKEDFFDVRPLTTDSHPDDNEDITTVNRPIVSSFSNNPPDDGVGSVTTETTRSPQVSASDVPKESRSPENSKITKSPPEIPNSSEVLRTASTPDEPTVRKTKSTFVEAVRKSTPKSSEKDFPEEKSIPDTRSTGSLHIPKKYLIDLGEESDESEEEELPKPMEPVKITVIKKAEPIKITVVKNIPKPKDIKELTFSKKPAPLTKKKTEDPSHIDSEILEPEVIKGPTLEPEVIKVTEPLPVTPPLVVEIPTVDVEKQSGIKIPLSPEPEESRDRPAEPENLQTIPEPEQPEISKVEEVQVTSEPSTRETSIVPVSNDAPVDESLSKKARKIIRKNK